MSIVDGNGKEHIFKKSKSANLDTEHSTPKVLRNYFDIYYTNITENALKLDVLLLSDVDLNNLLAFYVRIDFLRKSVFKLQASGVDIFISDLQCGLHLDTKVDKFDSYSFTIEFVLNENTKMNFNVLAAAEAFLLGLHAYYDNYVINLSIGKPTQPLPIVEVAELVDKKDELTKHNPRLDNTVDIMNRIELLLNQLPQDQYSIEKSDGKIYLNDSPQTSVFCVNTLAELEVELLKYIDKYFNKS